MTKTRKFLFVIIAATAFAGEYLAGTSPGSATNDAASTTREEFRHTRPDTRWRPSGPVICIGPVTGIQTAPLWDDPFPPAAGCP
jgi:hypothetical protein